MKDNAFDVRDLLPPELVLRAIAADRHTDHIDRATELRLELLAYEAALTIDRRVLPPSLLDFLA